MIQFSPEGNLVKLLQDGFVEAFADAVCLWMPRLDLGVFYACKPPLVSTDLNQTLQHV